jgi:peroxiredoxin (alkyl hydroperoxide reductase subunit C)
MQTLINTAIPKFKVEAFHNGAFRTVTDAELHGKWSILFFYPADFTFVCPTEITAFSDRYGEFTKINTEVLGASVDSEFSHLAWTQSDRKEGGIGNIAYPLVADLKKEISTAYNVLDPEAGVSLRGLFIIDQDGVLQYQVVHGLNIGRSVDETLRVLEALKTGGLCAAVH